MKKIIVHVQTDKMASRSETEIEVEDDAGVHDIEDAAKDAMFDMIEWGWREAGEDEEDFE